MHSIYNLELERKSLCKPLDAWSGLLQLYSTHTLLDIFEWYLSN
jgi:hypothetical protein